MLLSIQGGSDLGLFETNEAAQLVANAAAPDANIIFGAVIDDALGDEVRVTVIAAGLDENRSGRSASGADNGAALAPPAASRPSASTFAVPHPAPATPRPSPAVDSHWASDAVGSPELADLPEDLHQADGHDEADLPMVPAPLAALLGAPVSYDEPGSAVAATAPLAAPLPDPPALPPVPKTFDVAATRRRPVVFEEDDDLDIPDFLK